MSVYRVEGVNVHHRECLPGCAPIRHHGSFAILALEQPDDSIRQIVFDVKLLQKVLAQNPGRADVAAADQKFNIFNIDTD